MASSVIEGSVTGAEATRKYRFWVEWSSTPNASAGASYLRVKAYVQRTDGYAASAWNNNVSASQKTLVVDGTPYHSAHNGIDTRNSQKVLIAEVEKTISHNANGYRTVNISASFPKVVDNLTGGTLSGQAVLDYIDMSAPTLNATVTGTTATSVTLQVNSNAALSDIQYRVIGVSGWVSVGAGSSKTFTITGLSPNTTYRFELWGRKQSNSKEIYKTVSAKTGITPITAISFENKYKVSVGKTLICPPKLTPQNASVKTLRYTSSNPSVAELQSETGTFCTLLARSTGSVVITAKATDGSGVTGTCEIEVIQPVTGIQVTSNQLMLPVGGSAQIAYTVLPNNATNKNVTITSSDTSVVTVSGTVAVGQANGVATLTLTTEDGGYTAVVQVVVQGDYTWYDYPVPIDILNAEDVRNFHSDMTVLRGLILLRGESLPAFAEVDAQTNTPYRSIRALLQAVEDNLEILNSTPYGSAYYGAHITFAKYAPNKQQIFRWQQSINDMHNILKGDARMWQTLRLADGYPTIDGKKILIRGDYVE